MVSLRPRPSITLRLRDRLDEAVFQVPLSVGLAFFCLGLCCSGRAWGPLAALFAD